MQLILIVLVSLLIGLLGTSVLRNCESFCGGVDTYCRLHEYTMLLDGLMEYGLARLSRDSLLFNSLDAVPKVWHCSPWADTSNVTAMGVLYYHKNAEGLCYMRGVLMQENREIAERIYTVRYEPQRGAFTVYRSLS